MATDNPLGLKRGDIVQVNEGVFLFGGMPVVVDEIKSFGCQAFGITAADERAYVRLNWTDFTLTGGTYTFPEDEAQS